MDIVEQLASALEKTNSEVVDFIIDAPKKYKVYTIPKRTVGHRVIAQPSQELKVYQKKYIELNPFRTHEAAMAYRKGLGIKNNAQKHQGNCYLLKMDLEDFFNSITTTIFWKEWCAFYPQPGEADKIILERLLFWAPNKKIDGKLILSIGAPSSPSLSNFIMYRFDEVMLGYCSSVDVEYSRYADDLTFSSNEKNVLFELPGIVHKILMSMFDGELRVKQRKTVFSSKAHNRHVTGITINNCNNISLGRKRKRYIKHLVHQYVLNNLSRDKVSHLQGLLAFANHIEPDFIVSLNKKYMPIMISNIMRDKND
ncbi:retron St85 family RNA-directed DNA polymerase [Aeromonas caviae]